MVCYHNSGWSCCVAEADPELLILSLQVLGVHHRARFYTVVSTLGSVHAR